MGLRVYVGVVWSSVYMPVCVRGAVEVLWRVYVCAWGCASGRLHHCR
jgi:hypothetical protein